MAKRSSMMSKLLVFMLTFAVVFTYSVMPMNQAFAASAKKPAKVTKLKVASYSASQVKLTWKKAKNAKKYEIYASTQAKKNFKRVATVKASKRTYTVKKVYKKALKPNKKYYFKVRAVNGKKKGKFSKVVSKRTKKKVITKKAEIGEAKSATITTQIDMSQYEAGQVVKVWVPVPQTDEEFGYQTVSDVSYSATETEPKITTDKENGNQIFYVEWGADVAPENRKATLSFTATRYDVSRTNLKDNKNAAVSKEAKAYVDKESEYVKINDPIVKKYAAEAVKDVKDKNSTVEKTRAVYDWIINNLERLDDGEHLDGYTYDVEGCGYGDTVKILSDFDKYGVAGGHCTDLNSTFVALCRANGIAAREMFGIRLGNHGQDITSFQHCWAEFYLPGTGWVFADPADVLKAVKPAVTEDKSIDVNAWKEAKASEAFKEKAEFFWGHVDNNRVVLSRGRDVTFEPPQAWGKCNTFGYPAAEVGGKRMPADFTKGGEFKYTITSKAPEKPDFVHMDADEWATYGTKEVKVGEDYIIDVRPETAYKYGHFAGSVNSPVSNPYDAAQAEAIKAEFDKANGKRVVLICFSGNMLAKNAMAALQEKGADMSKVTYLIGGAKGVDEGTKADAAKWEEPDFNGKTDDNYNMSVEEWATFGIEAGEITNADLVIDVRPYAKKSTDGYVPGAVQIDDSTDAEALKETYDKMAETQNRVVIVCVTGNALARNAMAALQASGADMTKVTYLIGGFNNGWKPNYPVVSPDMKSVSVPAWVTTGSGSNGELMMVKDENGNAAEKCADMTHHVLVNENGSNAPVALLNTKALPLQVYNALKEIGGTPYDKFNAKDQKDEFSLAGKGSPVNVTIDLGSGAQPLDYYFEHVTMSNADILKDTSITKDNVPTEAYNVDTRFGGCIKNIENNFDSPSGNLTGCITCTFSCWIGTVSNGAYEYSTNEAKVIRDHAPVGTAATVVYTIGE